MNEETSARSERKALLEIQRAGIVGRSIESLLDSVGAPVKVESGYYSAERPRWVDVVSLSGDDFVGHGNTILKICYETVNS